MSVNTVAMIECFDSQGDFRVTDMGLWSYCPGEVQLELSSCELRAIADELDKRNTAKLQSIDNGWAASRLPATMISELSQERRSDGFK